MFDRERAVFFSVDGVNQATHFLYKNEVFPIDTDSLSILPSSCEIYLNPNNIDVVNTDESIPELLSVVDVKDSISIFARFPEECFQVVEEAALRAKKLPTFYAFMAPIRRLDRGVYFEIYHAKDAGIYKLTFFSIEEDLGPIGSSRISDQNLSELTNTLKEIVIQFSNDAEMHLYSNDALQIDFDSIFSGYAYDISKKSFVYAGKSKDFTQIPSNEVSRIIAHRTNSIGLCLLALSILGVVGYQYYTYTSITNDIEAATLEIQRLNNEKSQLELDLKSHAPAIAAYYATDTQPDWVDFFSSIREGLPEHSAFEKIEITKSENFTSPSWTYTAKLNIPNLSISVPQLRENIAKNRYLKDAIIVEHLSQNENERTYVMLSGEVPVYRNGEEVHHKSFGSSQRSTSDFFSSGESSGTSVRQSKRAKSLGLDDD